LKDEQFCLSFELEALAEHIISKNTGRWIPGFTDRIVDMAHESRYKWVSQYVLDKNVLDIACGSGKGSYIIATEGKAKIVQAVDIDEKAIRYASIRHKQGSIIYNVCDAECFDSNVKYDVIVSFETIEHIKNMHKFLSNINNILNKDGNLFISTPISIYDVDENPANSYHVREWGFRKFQEIISKYFNITNIFIQSHPVDISNMQLALNIVKSIGISKPGVALMRLLKIFHPYTYAISPIIWDPKMYPVLMMGSSFLGYQILQCNTIS
jgi:2-polyprenyl-3-methyl-5-hydroxy-6-metoxy-1,4-benzoquinol methylase